MSDMDEELEEFIELLTRNEPRMPRACTVIAVVLAVFGAVTLLTIVVTVIGQALHLHHHTWVIGRAVYFSALVVTSVIVVVIAVVRNIRSRSSSR